MAIDINTPGVYINEVNGFPNSVVSVATAVPAFIGYTPQAEFEGKSYYNTPVKITSFADFQAFFMLPAAPAPAEPVQQYSPQYYLLAQTAQPEAGAYLTINGQYYAVLPDPSTLYFMYNSVRLFYENGGGDAYIVSVGSYGPASKAPCSKPGSPVVNTNVQLTDLQNGLALLKNEQIPTLYICPDATLLSVEDNAILMQNMLQQAQDMGTAMCLFDVIGGADPDPVSYVDDIQAFRNNVGNTGLDYGACYYPFIATTIMQPGELDFTNVFGGDVTQLVPLLSPAAAPNATVENILSAIEHPPAHPLSHSQLQSALCNASATYSQIMNCIFAQANTLPPSAAMAGVYAANDNTQGVWCAPANVGINCACDLPIHLSDTQQANLNVDAASGKSINAIRFFNGLGILVWGARTLDGNSDDWRYVPVRRTVTYIEQSAKEAARAYVFQPNDKNTWQAVQSMIASFLMDLWKEGGLQGASAADAFQVAVGLGTTMTAQDILNGYMKVTVKVAVTHPAEFIVISFQQQQAASG